MKDNLDLQRTYRAILEAVRDRRYISYGDLAAANGARFSNVRFSMPGHLWELVNLAVDRRWPMLSAVVVNKKNLKTGVIDGTTREGFINAAKALGFDIQNESAFIEKQQKAIFDWAPDAPEDLDLSNDLSKTSWFVGAMLGKEDQTSRFLQEGLWENRFDDKYLDEVRSVRVGDPIAIKSTSVRKHNLPFEGRGHHASVMSIEAIGTVKSNPGDGRFLEVDWNKPVDPPREWFFFTSRRSFWRVSPDEWKRRALIRFTFENEEQDIDRFRSSPYWRDRFDDRAANRNRFGWTRFYEKVADGLLAFKDRREELVAGIHAISSRVEGLSIPLDQFADGSSGPLKDICPFTVMGIINRKLTTENRKNIAKELAELLGVNEPVPDTFDGIPSLNPLNSWFFHYQRTRKPDDIDHLWELFGRAVSHAGSDKETQISFTEAYDRAMQIHNVGWTLSMGLYWTRPWHFPALDSHSREYIMGQLNIKIGSSGPQNRCSADDYLAVIEELEACFEDDACLVHSFPELSLVARKNEDDSKSAPQDESVPGMPDDPEDSVETETPAEPYAIDNILSDGCFIERAKVEQILERLEDNKNLILQGPPGTGKTWLAKRLAYALMERRDVKRVRSVQFHPNLSYEDFIRGWRPAGDGKLALVDGPFMEVIEAARKDPTSKYVIVIEEINRGNPAQILGEMLTLLEADKRMPEEAIELSYRRMDGERVHIPENLYVIGTMNIADRSLALVDFALRRRFVFIDLEPAIGQSWRNWVRDRYGIDPDILDDIRDRMNDLNNTISAAKILGPQFRVGHSYVTPMQEIRTGDAKKWFRKVVNTQIGPLLDEYWYDDPEESKKCRERLIEGL